MSKYTAEQVKDGIAWLDAKYRRHGEEEDKQCAEMLRDYAALLRQHEAVKASTDEDVVLRANESAIECGGCAPPVYVPNIDPLQVLRGECYATVADVCKAWIAEREAAKAAVPDAIEDDDQRQFLGWSTTDIAYRAGWNQCREAMLEAAPKRGEG